MRTKLLSLLVVSFFLTRCGNESDESTETETTIADSTNKFVKPKLNDGPFVEKYPNGQIKIQGEIKNGTRFGQWKSFYPDGTKYSEEDFEDGKKNGKTATYYKNGRLRYLGYFTWDKPSGMWEFYDTLGAVVNKKEYK